MRKTTHNLLIFTLVALSAAGCGGRGTEANVRPNRTAVVVNSGQGTPSATATDANNVTVAEIASNWSNYAGKTVTVNGWAERAYGGTAFRLDEDSAFTGGVDNDLLVVGASGVMPSGMRTGDADSAVRVTGTVRRFVVAEIERDLNIDLTTELETEFRDKPVLVARSVQRIEE